MNQKQFIDAVLGESDKLGHYFHNKIMKIRSLRGEWEATKKELIQLTFIKAHSCHERKLEKGYSIVQIIWYAAEDVWLDMYRRNKQRYIDTIRVCDNLDIPSNEDEIARMEDQDEIDTALQEARVTSHEREIYSLHVEGYKYHEIAYMFDTSPNAIKQKVYYINKKIRKGGNRR
jgi:RNA polymerase sigma-70 factor (ECF subfamily)